MIHMKLERYSAMIQIVSGSITEADIHPPLTPEEKEILDSMIKEDEKYFSETGKHLIWEVPFGMFEEDYRYKKFYRSIYSDN